MQAGQEIREQLLEHATRLFAWQGVAATTMAQIAAAAGVTSAMVHYYFVNREKLLDAVVDERLARAMTFVWTDTADENIDAHARIQAMVGRLFEQTARMPWLPSLWLREVVNEGGLLRERVLSHAPVAQWQRLAQHIGRAQRDGSVNPAISPALLPMSIVALVMLPLAAAGALREAPGLPAVQPDALHAHVAALLSAALLNPSEPQKPKPRASRTTRRSS